MAPRVQVPMDFGVKYLGSPSHGNLKFRLQEGGEIPANSMIISYNSPVIESLTTDLMQTSIDVDDFSKDAVQCFVESCYSGDLRKITKTNFRDANKMSNVFEVSWLIARCYAFFEELANELDRENYEDQIYLFEEAMHIWVSLKDKHFVEVVIKKFSSEIVKSDHFFVPRYLNDLSFRTAEELDVVIEMVGEQKQVLMEGLMEDIGKNSECISANSRYLLENVSFTDCYSTNKLLYEKMFEVIGAIKVPSKDDFRLMLKLYEQSDKFVARSKTALKYATLPNCRFLKFQLIRDFPDLNKLMDFLITFPSVDNSYIFFDAVYYWVFQKSNNSTTSIDMIDFSAEKFIAVILERDWKPLVPEYLKGKDITCLTNLFAKLSEIPLFTSYKNYSRLLSVDDYSPQEFFQQNNDVKFYFKHPNTEKYQDRRPCGFILRVTASVAESDLNIDSDSDDFFDIKLIIDPKSYPNDMTFHNQCVNVGNMHLAFVVDKYSTQDYPISWSGKPSQDDSNKYCVWGQHRFYAQGEGTPPKNSYHTYCWLFGSDARLRLVVYHFG